MQGRKIFLDTETTGLFPEKGDRVLDIACVEMIDGKLTNNNYQAYVNPERDSNPIALACHGLTTEFLSDKPKFADVSDKFLEYIKGAELIIQKASFDVGFLDNELKLIGKDKLETYCDKITCNKVLARALYTDGFLTKELLSRKLVEDEKHVKPLREKYGDDDSKIIAELVKNPRFRVHSLDHLCKYFKIDLQSREQHHGALIDCLLLAKVYTSLQGVKKTCLSLRKSHLFSENKTVQSDEESKSDLSLKI